MIKIKGMRVIEKTTKLHPDLICHSEELFQCTEEYIEDLIKAEIPLPKVLRSEYEPGVFIFQCEYAGENILDKFKFNKLDNTINQSSIFDQMIDILYKAKSNKVNFDPHPKNFVMDNEALHYVDFTPPWKEKYYLIRLSVSKKKEAILLKRFFDCMDFDVLGYHLCADILKIDNKNYKYIEVLHEKLARKNMVSRNKYDFNKLVENIMLTEKKREIKKIYLL